MTSQRFSYGSTGGYGDGYGYGDSGRLRWLVAA